eukprot:364585-Chlamydomonas_euryale.AAC.7
MSLACIHACNHGLACSCFTSTYMCGAAVNVQNPTFFTKHARMHGRASVCMHACAQGKPVWLRLHVQMPDARRLHAKIKGLTLRLVAMRECQLSLWRQPLAEARSCWQAASPSHVSAAAASPLPPSRCCLTHRPRLSHHCCPAAAAPGGPPA